MFVSSSSLPPFVSGCGGLVCESVGKADLLSDQLLHFLEGIVLGSCLLDTE